jgi:hypothetical protein
LAVALTLLSPVSGLIDAAIGLQFNPLEISVAQNTTTPLSTKIDFFAELIE